LRREHPGLRQLSRNCETSGMHILNCDFF
jgi:hypothetical protein